jgi:hypothetical protein
MDIEQNILKDFYIIFPFLFFWGKKIGENFKFFENKIISVEAC